MTMTPETDKEPEISKTKRKQEASALQQLGQQLTSFNKSQLSQVPLPENVVNAINEYNRLPNSHGARRRQGQYIGRLMRDCDFDLIVAAIDRLASNYGSPKPVKSKSSDDNKSAELCGKILQQGDAEINTILQNYPRLERQKLRQYYRDYVKGNDEARIKTQHKLQTYIRQSIAG